MYLKLPSLRLRNSWDEIHGPFQSSIYLSCQAFWTELITSFSLKSSPSWFLSQKCTCFPPASLDPLWKSSRHHCSPSVLIFLPWTTSFLSKAWLSTPLVILMFVSPDTKPRPFFWTPDLYFQIAQWTAALGGLKSTSNSVWSKQSSSCDPQLHLWVTYPTGKPEPQASCKISFSPCLCDILNDGSQRCPGPFLWNIIGKKGTRKIDYIKETEVS